MLSGAGARDHADRQLREARKGRGGKNPELCQPFKCANAKHVATPKKGYLPTSNGCGSYGFKIYSKWHESCCDVSVEES